MDFVDLENRFRFHPATTDEKRRVHEEVRAVLLDAATELQALFPDGREKSLAVTKLEEAMFWANAAIARQP